MRHAVDKREAGYLRAYAGKSVADARRVHPRVSWPMKPVLVRIRPGLPERAQMATLPAGSPGPRHPVVMSLPRKPTCRHCFQRITDGERAIRFTLWPHGEEEQNPQTAWLHADACPSDDVRR